MQEQKTFDEMVVSIREDLQLDTEDDKLILAINNAMGESTELKGKMDDVGENNKSIWQYGSLLDFSKWHPKRSRVVNNRIFVDIETAIPIITSEPPEPSIIGDLENDAKETLKKGLRIAYDIKYRMQGTIQKLVRSWYLNRIGILKYKWDEKKGFKTFKVSPKKIGFDSTATRWEDVEYIWEIVESTLEDMIAKFPGKKAEIIKQANVKNDRAKLSYTEFWGGNGEWYACRFKEIILEKKKNPNYDWEDEDNNIFDKPQFPYILLNIFNLEEDNSVYDDTSLIEQAQPLQDGVNQLEQQIIDLNEGQKRVWVISGESVAQKTAQELVNKTGDLMLYLDKKAPASSITQVQSGKPDASLFNNLNHLLNEIDNIIGMHSTTRGERSSQETLGGRQLLKGSDLGRLDLIVRNIEKVIQDWYTAYLQMLKVYADEADVLMDENEKVELNSDEIPSDILILVKKDSTLPVDPVSRAQMARQLAGGDKIDPATLFEEMGYSKVDERVNNLYEWLSLTGKIDQQALANIKANSSEANAGRVAQIVNSDAFKQLSPEDQKVKIQELRQTIK